MKKIIFILFLIALTGNISAQPPRMIAYQGLIRLSNGLPVSDGNHAIKISLYDAPQNGNLIYTEADIVTTSGGKYTMFLGGQTPLPDSLTFGKLYFVGVAIDAGPELIRTAFTSAPYALNASLADGLTENAVIPKNLLKLSPNPGGAAGGDLSGKYPAPIVTKFRTQPVTSATPQASDRLQWNGKSWELLHVDKSISFLLGGDSTLTIPLDSSFTITSQSGSGIIYEDSNYINSGASTFIAPQSGAYEFSTVIKIHSNDTATAHFASFNLGLKYNAKVVATQTMQRQLGAKDLNLDYTSALKLQAGEKVQFFISRENAKGTFTVKEIEFAGYKID